MLRPDPNRSSGEVGEGALGRAYLRLLAWCLRHRWVTLGAAGGFFALSLALVPMIPSDFVPAADRGRSALAIELAPGATLQDTEAAVQRATAILKARPEVVSVFASLGTSNVAGGPGMGSTTTQGDPRNANLIITLVPHGERRLTPAADRGAGAAGAGDASPARASASAPTAPPAPRSPSPWSARTPAR